MERQKKMLFSKRIFCVKSTRRPFLRLYHHAKAPPPPLVVPPAQQRRALRLAARILGPGAGRVPAGGIPARRATALVLGTAL